MTGQHLKQGRLHIRLEADLAATIKEYADRHGTTVTRLVDAYFRQLLKQEQETTTDEAEQI